MPTPIRGQIAGYNASFTSDASDWVGAYDGAYNGGMGLVTDTAHGGTQAYLLDQVNDHIEIADNDAFSFPGEFSIACWAKFGSTSGTQVLISKISSATITGEWYLLLSGGLLYAGVFGPSGNFPSRRRTAPFASTAWSHLAMTYDGAALKIYVDGVRVDNADANDGVFSAMGNTSEPVRIGARGTTVDRFGGRLDDIRIANVAWTIDEIGDLAGSRVYEPPVPLVLTLTTDKSEYTVYEAITVDVDSSGPTGEELTCTITSDPPDQTWNGTTIDFTVGTPIQLASGVGGTAGTYVITASAGSATDSVTITVVPGPIASQASLALSALTERQQGWLSIASYQLASTTSRITDAITTRQTHSRLRISSDRTRGNTVIDLTWSDLADNLPALYRSFLALQLQLPAVLIEPTVTAADTSTGENIPVLIRGRVPELPATTDRLKLILQPPRGVVPSGITITISDYTNS